MTISTPSTPAPNTPASNTSTPITHTPLAVLRMGLVALGLFIIGPVLSGVFGAPYLASWSWVAAFCLSAVMVLRADELIERIEGAIGDSDIRPRRLRYLYVMRTTCMVIVAITSCLAVFAIVGGVSASTMFG